MTEVRPDECYDDLKTALLALQRWNRSRNALQLPQKDASIEMKAEKNKQSHKSKSTFCEHQRTPCDEPNQTSPDKAAKV